MSNVSKVPGDLRYTREHEWAKQEGATIRVGITAYAQEQLGDVVFVELPKDGAKLTAHQAFGVVETVKAVSDLFAPVSGQVESRSSRASTSMRWSAGSGESSRPRSVHASPDSGSASISRGTSTIRASGRATSLTLSTRSILRSWPSPAHG